MNDRVGRHLPPGTHTYRSIGEHLVELGDLRAEDVAQVLAAQRKSGLLFGQTAIRVGLIDAEHLTRALARQYLFPVAPADYHLSSELIIARDPQSPAAECIRNLRVQISARRSGSTPHNAIAIVSTQPQEGRSFIAGNLAVAYAQSHVRTLLVDMDLRRPRQHELFRLSNGHGFSSAVIGHTSAELTHAIPGYEALAVMTSGPLPPNPLELLESQLARGLLETLHFQHELLIVDTPSWATSADAQVIGALCGAAVLVSRPGRAVSHTTREFLSALSTSGVQVIGAVMNAV
jgi:receptor protein-tyrosine kinase